MGRVLDELARAVRSIFRAQRAHAEAGKVRFGDWDYRLAQALADPLERLNREADLLALQAAKGINDTTEERLRDGDDPRDVFNADRVAQIAATEYSRAKHDAMLQKGGWWQWDAKDDACDECRYLDGHIVEAGAQFIVPAAGVAVFGPPLHPSCYCTLKKVPAPALVRR